MEDNKKTPGSFAVIPKDDHALVKVVVDGIGGRMGVQFEMNSVQQIESLIMALEKSKDNIMKNSETVNFGMQLAGAAWLNWKRSHKWKWK